MNGKATETLIGYCKNQLQSKVWLVGLQRPTLRMTSEPASKLQGVHIRLVAQTVNPAPDCLTVAPLLSNNNEAGHMPFLGCREIQNLGILIGR